MTRKYLLGFGALVLGILVFVACSKDNSKGTTNLKINLTDNPYNATEVNVDIREVKVKVVDSSWINLPTVAGIYNLLNFQNGVDTSLAQGIVPTGTVQEI